MARKITEEIKGAINENGVKDLSPVDEWISTGCTLMDLAITGKLPGGFPVGRISHIFGAESTCKTVIGTTILGAAQRNGAIAFFADVEQTFDHDWATLFGLNCSNKDNFRLGHPRTIEEFFDSYLKDIIELKDDRQRVVVVDSLSAMPANAEIEGELEKGSFGTMRAKQMSIALRKYIRPLSDTKTSVIFIDQSRMNIGFAYGPKETYSGGMALKFYASTRIHLKHGTKEKNKKDVEIGTWINFLVDKSKVSAPHRGSEFCILYDYGIDNIHSNLLFLQEAQKEDRTVSFNGTSGFMSKMIKYVEENNLEEKLDAEVEKAWLELYKADDTRKQRVWK